jgi:hypothetical protein
MAAWFIVLYSVALYIVDQTLQDERGGHNQQLIPLQYVIFIKNAVFTHELTFLSMQIVKTNSFFMFSFSPIINLHRKTNWLVDDIVHADCWVTLSL